MPYITKWEEKGIFWIFGGIVTHQDIFDSSNEFYEDSRSDSLVYQLVDLSNIEDIEFNKITMQQISFMDYASSQSISDIKVAFISIKAHVTEHINQYIERSSSLNSSWSFKIFDDIESARKWVGSQY